MRVKSALIDRRGGNLSISSDVQPTFQTVNVKQICLF